VIDQATIEARRDVLRLATGYWATGVVWALARFAIADCLAAAPQAPDVVAATLGLRPDPLARLLRAAASLGLVASDAAGRFGLTATGQVLRGDAPGSIRDNVISVAGIQREAWRHDALEAALAGPGAGGWPHVAGARWFDWLETRPEHAAAFQRGMQARHAHEPAAIVAALDLQRHRCVLDLGGGDGQLLAAVLGAAPHLSGILLDLPAGIAAARRGAAGSLPRCRLVAHDFLQPLPGEVRADLILAKRVIHDFDDAEARTILAHATAALDPGGRIVVLDAVLAPGDAADPVKLLDLHMLLLLGGRERDAEGFSRLFAAAGLRLVALRPVLPGLAAIEGEAAGQPTQ
jgi:SAM-dependent methyltransferase